MRISLYVFFLSSIFGSICWQASLACMDQPMSDDLSADYSDKSPYSDDLDKISLKGNHLYPKESLLHDPAKIPADIRYALHDYYDTYTHAKALGKTLCFYLRYLPESYKTYEKVQFIMSTLAQGYTDIDSIKRESIPLAISHGHPKENVIREIQLKTTAAQKIKSCFQILLLPHNV